MDRKKYSIVTVCWNAEEEIECTLKSVFSQKYTNFEYLIIDGESSDHTVDIIHRIAKEYDKENNVVLISETDRGIYDAMNKGITLATGEWILFLNAGDTLFNDSVLDNVSLYLSDQVDFVYGDANYLENEFSYIVKAQNIETIKERMPFCHQAVFNRSTVIKKFQYNFSKYQICADYDLYTRAYIAGNNFLYIPIVVCNYVYGGFSLHNINRMYEEIADIRYRESFIKNKTEYILKMRLRIWFGKIGKTFLPQSIIKRIKKRTKIG